MMQRRWTAAAIIVGMLGTGGMVAADAQLTRILPAEPVPARPAWHGMMEGWQIGPWGAPGAHRWQIDADGRGSIVLPGPPRTGGARMIERPFALTAAEHARFAGLIERFVDGQQDVGLCATDQAQDVVRWAGGTRPAGLFNFDHGCRDPINSARLTLLTEAVAILRMAALRSEG